MTSLEETVTGSSPTPVGASRAAVATGVAGGAALALLPLAAGASWAAGPVALVLVVLAVRRSVLLPVAAFAVLLVPVGWTGTGLLVQKFLVLATLVAATAWAAGRGSGDGSVLGRLGGAARRERLLAATLASPLLLVVLQLVVLPVDPWRPVAHRTVDYLLAVALALSVLVLGAGQARAARRAASGFVLLLSLEAALGLAQATSGGPLLVRSSLNATQLEEAANIPGFFRGIGTVGHGNSLSLLLVLGLPVALWLFWSAQERRPRLLAAAGTATLTLGVLGTASRTGLLCLGILGLLTAAKALSTWPLRRSLAAAGAIVVTAAVTVATVPVVQALASRFFGAAAGTRDAGSNQVRASMARTAEQAFAQHPLLGHGLGRSSEVIPALNPALPGLGTHDLYLDALVGVGLVGTLLLGAVLLVALWRAFVIWGRLGWLTMTPALFLLTGLFETVSQSPFLALLGLVAGVSVLQRPRPTWVGRDLAAADPVELTTRQTVWGGGEVFLSDVADELVRRGFRASVTAPPGSALATRRPDLRHSRRETPGLVVANDFRQLWRTWPRTLGARRVFVVHGEWQTSGLRNLAVRMLRSGVVAVSSPVAGAVRGHAFGGGLSVEVLPVGPPLQEFRPASPEQRRSLRDRFGLGPEELVACFIGRLQDVKRPEVFAAAVRSAGWHGLMLTPLPSSAEEQALLDGALQAGGDALVLVHDGQAHEVLAAADVFVSTSEFESLGIAHLEAMATGLPVISTAVGGPADFLTEGVTGSYAPGGSTDAVTEALSALTTPEARDRAGAGNRARLDGRGVDAVADTLLRVAR